MILDVDGHKSLMALFGEESKASRNHLPELNREIETASFRVLGELCSQAKGRSVVSKADNFDDCVLYAMQLESAMLEPAGTHTSEESAANDSYEPPEYDGGDAEPETMEPDEEVVEDEEVDANTSEPAGEAPAPESPVSIRSQDDVSLEVAAYGFLSSLVSIEKCRPIMLEDKDFIRASLVLAKCSPSFDLKSEAVRYLVAISPYAKREADKSLSFSAVDLMEVFREALHFDTLSPLPLTANAVQSTAMEGAERIFDIVSAPFQCSVITHVLERFTRLVKTVTRPTKGETKAANGGLLGCSLTLLLLRSVGNKDAQNLLFTSDLLTSMIQLTQWRSDPKLRTEEQEQLQWDATITHCLQIIAFVFRRTEESLQQAGIVPATLARTVFMISRPGKAPRKAIDFKTALRRIVDERTNLAAVVAAQRILVSLED